MAAYYRREEIKLHTYYSWHEFTLHSNCYESLLARQSRGDGNETRNITHANYYCDKVKVCTK